MPGVLMKRSHDQLEPEKDASRNTVDSNSGSTVGEGLKRTRSADFTNGLHHRNGTLPTENGPYTNGNTTISKPPSASFPPADEAIDVATGSPPPPPLTNITEGLLIPLSKVITRLAQDTYNETNEVINKVAEIEESRTPADSPAVATQKTIEKKTRLFEFAQQRKVKFIKALVLSDWSRNAEDVAKCIDVNHWINQQKMFYREAVAWAGSLNNFVAHTKLPAPNLPLALEALSTGKADWLPHLGFIPLEPLTPQEMLKALRTINTLLTIRLTLHEPVPPYMNNFSIKNGRATFKVEDEFELDLSIADDDLSTQLYFIDFRFSFDPCRGGLGEGRLRNELEWKVNEILKTSGLSGCYDLLHDISLTHKLTTLKHQAYDMARGFWSENINIESARRGFVVQYWTNRPGGKSWIELGVKSGKVKGVFEDSSNIPPKPNITIRWHRHGKEVLDHGIGLDLSDLSMEHILKQVITLHTNYIFKEIKQKLRDHDSVYGQKLLSVKHRAAMREPTDCSIKIQTTMTRTVTLLQEPVTGLFALIPPSPLHDRTERELNMMRDPANEALQRIATLKCLSTIEEVDEVVKSLNWKRLRILNPTQETISKMFSSSVTRLAFYRLPSWPKNWIVAISTSLRGDVWWIVEQRDPTVELKASEIASGADKMLRSAFQISGMEAALANTSQANLESVEIAAAAVVSQVIDARELSERKMSFTQKVDRLNQKKVRIPDLIIQLPETHRLPFPSPLEGHNYDWCYRIIKSRFTNFSRDNGMVHHFVTGRLITPIPNISLYTSKMDSSVAFHPTNGTFLFRISTPIGFCTVPILIEHLNRTRGLIQFLETIRRHSLVCDKISLNEIIFAYTSPSQSTSLNTAIAYPALRATIKFSSTLPLSISFDKGNPHIRIQDFLATLLKDQQNFVRIVSILRTTAPLLRAFDALESTTFTATTNNTFITQENEHEGQLRKRRRSLFQILPRSALAYRIQYQDPPAIFEIRLRQRGDEIMWFSFNIAATSTPSAAGSVDEFATSNDKNKKQTETVSNDVSPKSAENKKIKDKDKVKEKDKVKGEEETKGAEYSHDTENTNTKAKEVEAAWEKLTTEKSPHWMGMRGGISARVEGVEALLFRIDEIVQNIDNGTDVVEAENKPFETTNANAATTDATVSAPSSSLTASTIAATGKKKDSAAVKLPAPAASKAQKPATGGSHQTGNMQVKKEVKREVVEID